MNAGARAVDHAVAPLVERQQDQRGDDEEDEETATADGNIGHVTSEAGRPHSSWPRNSTPRSESNSSRACPEPMTTEWSGLGAMLIGMPVSCSSRTSSPMQQRAAAGDRDARLHDVGGQLRRRLVERGLDGVDDGRDGLLERLADLLGRDLDRLGQAGDQVAAPHLGA